MENENKIQSVIFRNIDLFYRELINNPRLNGKEIKHMILTSNVDNVTKDELKVLISQLVKTIKDMEDDLTITQNELEEVQNELWEYETENDKTL